LGGTPATISFHVLTHVLSSIDVTMKTLSVKVVKRYVFRWLIASGTPFVKTIAPSFHGIFDSKISGISGYTGLSRQTFNTMIDEEYTVSTPLLWNQAS
jgi:hypothetical protein